MNIIMSGMVDLHTHVLFDIDDGSDTVEESLALLREAEDSGIVKMALTPHFSVGEDVGEFLEKRNERFEKLKKAAEREGVGILLKCGAEVYITDEIYNEAELDRLAIGESRVILSEFKYHGLSGEKFLDYVDEIISHKLIPLIAHPERYSYLRRSRMLVNALISRGALLQVNAVSLFDDSDEGAFARMLVERGAASVIGSDVHHTDSYRLEAVRRLKDMDNDDISYMTEDAPDMIFENSKEIASIEPELL